MKKPIILTIAVILFLIIGYSLISPSSSDNNEQILPPTEDSSSITGKTWYWISTTDPVAQTTVPNPENFTLTLQDDGSYVALADCNTIRGSYDMKEGSISIMPGASTKAYCGDDSLSDKYIASLMNTATYFLLESDLYIDQKMDAGTMRFSLDSAPLMPSN